MNLKNMALSENIKYYREKRFLSQSGLAKIAEVTPSQINKLENNHSEGSLQLLKKISNALGINLSQLFEEKPCNKLKNEQLNDTKAAWGTSFNY